MRNVLENLNINEDMIVKPVLNSHISSPFGVRIYKGVRQSHNGLDIGSSDANANILSICDGVVCEIGFSNSFGNRVWIKATCGPYENKYIVYAHMKSLSNLKKGDKVNMSDVLGIIGNTGLSSGIHLHIEVADSMGVNRTPVNPIELSNLYKE